MLQNIFSHRPPLYDVFDKAESYALHPPCKCKFARFMFHWIAIWLILEKINIYNFYVYHQITIWLIYANLLNGNFLVNIKIVNIYLFPKLTKLPFGWFGNWSILGTLRKPMTCVKNSVHRARCAYQGVCVAAGVGIHGRGAYMAGGVCGGGMRGRGACMTGGMCGRMACMAGVIRGGDMRGRRDGHCNGRYASYWNAFLFYMEFWKHFRFPRLKFE